MSTEPQLPDGIGAENVSEGGAWRRHASPASLVVFGLVVVLALTGVLGHERLWEASAAGGTRLTVHMPEVIRNGEFVEMRLTVEPAVAIEELVIDIDQALWEDMTVNTMIPAPTEESSRDGRFSFTFGEIDAGASFLLKVDAQINPDIVGGNAGVIIVRDGTVALVEMHVEMAVLP